MAERQISEAELLQRVLDARLAEVHVALPGRVQSFNRTAQTAEVIPQVWPDGEELPVIPAVPVVYPRGLSRGLYFGLDAGDPGLLLFLEADLSQWRQQGEPGAPADLGRHSLQSAVFLPGLVARGEEADLPVALPAVLFGADVRLGSASATKHVAAGEDVNSAITTWASAVSLAITGLGGDISGPTTQLGIDLAAALSPSVKVED